MARFSFFLLALIGALGLVNCQFNRDDREILERERERDRDLDRAQFRRPAEGCTDKVMDIFFLLDSSSSIYIHDYMSQHRFVREIISRFDIRSEYTRVGMLTFSDDLERPVISLNQYNGKAELLNSISMQNLPYRTGVTNTDMAIRYVRQLSDFRQDITKVMVVLTDGGSRSPGSTAREAELARNSGFYMFVVGIGQYLEEREWRSIASDPDDSFVYNITNPRFLDEVQTSLPPRACALPPIRLGGSCDITRMSEIYFVAGTSGQISAQNFLDDFGRSTRDRDDDLRVNFFIDGCAAVQAIQLLNEEPFICERYDRQGNVINPRGASELLEDVMRFLRDSRATDTNQVVVVFLNDETFSAERNGLSSSVRSLEIQGATVIFADFGLRTYRNDAQRLLSRRNFISLIGTNGSRNLLDSICTAANAHIFSGGIQ